MGDLYTELHQDVYTELTKYLSTRETMVLAQVCKASNKILTKEWYNKKIGKFTLRHQQYLFCKMIDEAFKIKRKCILSASLGFGKTICSIYFFMHFCRDWNVLIIIPSSVCKVWIEQLSEIGLIDSKPERSTVLVFHSVRPNHHKYHDKHEQNMFKDHRIVLTTDVNSRKFHGKPDLIIYDEYHKTDKRGGWDYVQNDFQDAKVLGLTGENIQPGFNMKVLMLRDVEFIQKIPDVSFHYYNIDNGRDDSYAKYNAHIDDLGQFEEEYKEKFFECVQTKEKMVISVDRGKIGTAVREWVAQLPEYKVFELKSSTQTIHMFMKFEGKAILFIGSNNNEGLNIFAEHLIFVKPDILATVRIVQTIGRLCRPGNQHKRISVNFIVGGKIASLKALYAAAHTHTNYHFDYEDTPPIHLLLKARSIIGLLGYFGDDYLKFPLVDACVVFDHVHTRERYKQMLEWWKANRTKDCVLNEEYIDALYA